MREKREGIAAAVQFPVASVLICLVQEEAQVQGCNGDWYGLRTLHTWVSLTGTVARGNADFTDSDISVRSYAL